MRHRIHLCAIALTVGLASASFAQDAQLGQSVESLLKYARDSNPEYASMRFDVVAAQARIDPAGALPDPKFRTEWRDITRAGDQNPTLLPGRVGSTRYL